MPCPNLSCCPKNLSCPKIGGGGGGAVAPPSPPARTPMQLVITTDFCVKRNLVNIQVNEMTRQKTAKKLHKEDFPHSQVVLSPISETISYN